MDFKLIGSPCGQHGPYTFYKAFKYSKHGKTNILALSEFFFVKLWNDSDLVSIGELQLLWEDKNSEQTLASLRLYILPENTPEGRSDCHGEHEVLAITEKVVLRVEDLLTWITEAADWSWGLSAVYNQNTKLMPRPGLLSDNSAIDLSEVDTEKEGLGQSHWDSKSGVVVLSFPRYCRYRGILKRLEGVYDKWLRAALVAGLGGFTVPCRNTRVLYCRETFDYPDLEGHELLCNHLAPKLKGRPRKKRKLLDISPDSSDSESSSESSSSSSTKMPQRSLSLVPQGRAGVSIQGSSLVRRAARSPACSSEEREFLARLHAFMKSRQTPINRVPTIGFKELDLYKLFSKVRHLGGYDAVTASRLWKYVYEEMGGDQSSTSAATCCRRHYERLLLPYEKHLAPNRSKAALAKLKKFDEISITTKTPHTNVKPTSNLTTKKQKLEILKEGGLEVTAITTLANGKPNSVEKSRASVIQPPRVGDSERENSKEKVSITITPDVGHMLPNSQHHAWSLGSRVYGNPKEVMQGDPRSATDEILDLRTKNSNLEITLVPPSSSATQTFVKGPQLTIPMPHRQNHAQKLYHNPPRLLNKPALNQKIPSPIANIPNGRGGIVPSVSISVNQHQKRKSKTTATPHSSQGVPSYKAGPYSVMDPVYLSAFYSGLFTPYSPSSTPQQVQFYKELLHQHNIPDSFPRLLQDGSTSISLVNQTPTPPSK